MLRTPSPASAAPKASTVVYGMPTAMLNRWILGMAAYSCAHVCGTSMPSSAKMSVRANSI